MESLQDMPGHLIRRAQQVSNAIFAEECAGFDLTSVQYAALHAIAAHDGIDATRLSGLIALDRSTIGDVLERLESKGWIVRAPGSLDKRTKRLHLAQSARALLDSVEPAVRRVQQRLLEPFSGQESAAILEMLRKIGGIDATDTGGAPRSGKGGDND